MVQSRQDNDDFNRSRAHLENLLDQALMETFPASDPVAIEFEEVKLTVQPSIDQQPSARSALRVRLRATGGTEYGAEARL